MSVPIQDIKNNEIQMQAPQLNDAKIEPRNNALGDVAKPSKLALFGRIVLGIFTLGISEGVRALVNKFSARAPVEPRINRNENPIENKNIESKTEVDDTDDDLDIEKYHEERSIPDHAELILDQYKMAKDLRSDNSRFEFQFTFAYLEDKLNESENSGGEAMTRLARDLLDANPKIKNMILNDRKLFENIANETDPTKGNGGSWAHTHFAQELLRQVDAQDNLAQDNHLVEIDPAKINKLLNNYDSIMATKSNNLMKFIALVNDIQEEFKEANNHSKLDQFTKKLLDSNPELKKRLENDRDFLQSVAFPENAQVQRPYVEFAREILKQIDMAPKIQPKEADPKIDDGPKVQIPPIDPDKVNDIIERYHNVNMNMGLMATYRQRFRSLVDVMRQVADNPIALSQFTKTLLTSYPALVTLFKNDREALESISRENTSRLTQESKDVVAFAKEILRQIGK